MNKAKAEELRAARARLTNPIDRIAFDNQRVDGLPVGLLLLAHESPHDSSDKKPEGQ